MEIRTFCKNQREVASAVNTVLDMYWEQSVTENEMVNTLIKLFENNKEKILKNHDYTKVLKQQCGKKRLDVLSIIISSQEDKKNV